MVTGSHVEQAHIRLQELDHLTDQPIGSPEWWETFAVEVDAEPHALQAAVDAAIKHGSERAAATRGVLVGLLAARYAVLEGVH